MQLVVLTTSMKKKKIETGFVSGNVELPLQSYIWHFHLMAHFLPLQAVMIGLLKYGLRTNNVSILFSVHIFSALSYFKKDFIVNLYFILVLFPSKSADNTLSYGQSTQSELNYGFVYISHPRAVTQLSWRKTSKYMPK
jgi:hypothetical protein